MAPKKVRLRPTWTQLCNVGNRTEVVQNVQHHQVLPFPTQGNRTWNTEEHSFPSSWKELWFFHFHTHCVIEFSFLGKKQL